MVVVPGDRASGMSVHLGRRSISRFRVLERMPRVVPVILSERAVWHSQHLLDARVRVPPCRVLMMHVIFLDPVVPALPVVRIVRMIGFVQMEPVVRVWRLAPAPRHCHVPLADRLPARLHGVCLLYKIPYHLFVLACSQLRLAATPPRKPFVELGRQMGGPHAVTAAPRAPDNPFKVGVPLGARGARDLTADPLPRLVQLPVAEAPRRDCVVDECHRDVSRLPQ